MIIVLSTPLSETTRGFIGQAELDTLSPDSYVINVSRGAVIETEALVAALEKSDITGATLDVTDPEPLPKESSLWETGNVLTTPHVGGHTPNHWERLAEIVAHNVRQLDAGADAEFRNQVNELPGDSHSPPVEET